MKTFITLLFFLRIFSSQACICSGSSEYSMGEFSMEWHNSFDYVFIGKVLEVTDINRFTQKALIENRITIKGQIGKQIEIIPPHGGSSCEFDLKKYIGKELYIYAYKDEKGVLTTHFCAGTRRLYNPTEIDSSDKKHFKITALQELNFSIATRKKKNGTIKTYYSNGNLTGKGHLKEGKPVGKWKYYSYHGQITSKGEYKDTLKDGFWIEYEYDYDAASKKQKLSIYSSGYYVNGEKIGEWKSYKENGEYWYSNEHYLK